MPSATDDVIDAPLARLLRHIVDAMNPLEVWLFGSRAENRARPTSDYDLLVVMPDETPEPELDPVRAWRLGWETQVTADIIPCTRSEFDEEKHELDSLPRTATLRGRKIYERREASTSLPRARDQGRESCSSASRLMIHGLLD